MSPLSSSTAKGNLIKALDILEGLGLFIITMAALVAVGQEIHLMYLNGKVMLQDILMLFIFLEIFTMVGLYFTSGKLPIRYPIYIAIVAIARYITIGMKQMDGWTIISLSAAILILMLALLVFRFGQARFSVEE